MALLIEQVEEISELTSWSLPERLPETPNVKLRSFGDFSELSPSELTRVNFGVTEAARTLFEGGGAQPAFGYAVEFRTKNVYAVTHNGLVSQAPVEGLVVKRGSIHAPEFVLFQARRIQRLVERG